MTVIWRIDKAKWEKQKSFSGDGASQYGGRWNHPGTRVVYASESLSLAALEKLVHLGEEGRSIHFVYYQIYIPSKKCKIKTIYTKKLPITWRQMPPQYSTKNIGTDWVKNNSNAILKVPSIIVPIEYNYLLNPAHPDFKLLNISDPEPFSFDLRLWK